MELWPFAVIIISLVIITSATAWHLLPAMESLPNSLLSESASFKHEKSPTVFINGGDTPTVLYGGKMESKAYHIKFTVAAAPEAVVEELLAMFNSTQRRACKALERKIFGHAGALPVLQSTSELFKGHSGSHITRVGENLSIDVKFATAIEVDTKRLLSLFSEYIINPPGSVIIQVRANGGLFSDLEYIKHDGGVTCKSVMTTYR